MPSPFPNLQVWPNSGLSFPWAEYHPDGTTGSGDFSFGSDGVALGMVMLIPWQYLGLALKELLGYSYRDTTSGTPRLRRHLPWQNAYSNQLFVKNITSVKGLQLKGIDLAPGPGEGGVGIGAAMNLGPGSIFSFAQITIHFWRPPYFVRSDDDIPKDSDGQPEEWHRYVDKNWELSTDVLYREGSFVFEGGPGDGTPFHTPLTQRLSNLRIKRRWYQLPEAAIFTGTSEPTPNGIPENLLYTQTRTTNPLTGYVYPVGSPLVGCVNTPIEGGHVVSGGPPFVLDDDPTKQFFGFDMGTLLLEGIEIIPQPLQLPPALMAIPYFENNEPIAQVQYDVVFHYSFFDPPVGADSNGMPVHPYQGHNLRPYGGSGMWYPVRSQQNVSGGTSPPFVTPFQYADLSDAFYIL